MSQTKIQWTQRPRPDGSLMPGYTFNAWWGCVEAGPECDRCYARTFSHRLGLALWGTDAPRRPASESYWREPQRWSRKAAELGEQHLVFAHSMSDVLEDRRDLDPLRARLWELIEATPNLIWLLLTKRPSKYSTLTPERWRRDGWPQNVWAGCTAGTQRTADVLVPQLLEAAAGAAVRWVSCEPLLEGVDFRLMSRAYGFPRHITSDGRAIGMPQGIDWIVFGFESGAGARQGKLAWIRDGLRQCWNADLPAFVKQVGRRPQDDGDLYGRPVFLNLEGAGGDPAEWPEWIRVREFPAVVAP